MIRKLDYDHYCLTPRQLAANSGQEWGAEACRVRTAADHRDRAMQVFKRARPPVPLQPNQKRSTEWH
jgi:hypothetical protein